MMTTNPYPTTPAVHKGELPDPFLTSAGTRVVNADQWPAQGAAWQKLVIDTEYGGMPPAPAKIEVETLAHSAVRRWEEKPQLWSYRIHCHGGERPFSFCVRILFPSGPGPFPAIINGDGCWWYITEEIAQRVIRGGCALVMFNRTEFAEDLGYAGVQDPHKRSGGLYEIFPDLEFGALSAWAWGYHRCVDLLQELSFIHSQQIAVTGHSRGGKAVLVAGATDSRIGLVNDNASCAGGSAAFRYVGDGGETLDIVNRFPSWFGPGLRPLVGREEEIPFDQHCLLAAIAPRPLLLTYALEDRWSNPEGMVQCAWAAGEVYKMLGRPENLAFHLREGVHRHSPEDWEVLMDFIGVQWQGQALRSAFNSHPYSHLSPAFSWRAPTPQEQAP